MQGQSICIVTFARVKKVRKEFALINESGASRFPLIIQCSFCSRGSNVFCSLGCRACQQAHERSNPTSPACRTWCFQAQSGGCRVGLSSSSSSAELFQPGWQHLSCCTTSRMCHLCHAALEATLVPSEPYATLLSSAMAKIASKCTCMLPQTCYHPYYYLTCYLVHYSSGRNS